MNPADQPGRPLPVGPLALASVGTVVAVGVVATTVAAYRAGITAASVLAPAAITGAAFAYGVAYLCLLDPRSPVAWTNKVVQVGWVRTAISMTVAVGLAQALQIRPTVFWTAFLGLTLLGIMAEALVLVPALRGPAIKAPPLSSPTSAVAGRASP